MSEEKKTETREEMIARLVREEAKAEMMFELRAAFGGETDEVVNILTGERIRIR